MNWVFLPGESPWTEQPGGLSSEGSQRFGHSWAMKHTHKVQRGWEEKAEMERNVSEGQVRELRGEGSDRSFQQPVRCPGMLAALKGKGSQWSSHQQPQWGVPKRPTGDCSRDHLYRTVKQPQRSKLFKKKKSMDLRKMTSMRNEEKVLINLISKSYFQNNISTIHLLY